MNNQDLIRQFMESIKRDVEREMEKGINKPRSTVRHLEASEDGSITQHLTGLPAYAHELED